MYFTIFTQISQVFCAFVVNIWMDVHLVGNGECQSLYVWHRGTVVACNIPKKKDLKYDILSIIDAKVINYLKNHPNDIRPVQVWCTDQIKKQADALKLPGEWQAVYQHRHRFNSGHHAVQHLAKQFNKIHLWGMDSMFSTDLTSKMDQLIPRPNRPDLNREWRPHWQEIFNANPQCEFVVHVPQKTKVIEYAKNCFYQYH